MCLLTETRALSAQGEKRALVGNLTMPRVGFERRRVDPNGVPLHQVGVRQPLQHPREHRLVRLDVDQPARARQGRMVRRHLVQREVQELPDAQRIGRAPRDGPLRVQALKIAEQQQLARYRPPARLSR